MRFLALIATLAAGTSQAQPHDNFSDCTLNLAWFIMQERETKTRILESRLRTNVSPEEMDAAAGKLLQASTDFLETYADYCATLR